MSQVSQLSCELTRRIYNINVKHLFGYLLRYKRGVKVFCKSRDVVRLRRRGIQSTAGGSRAKRSNCPGLCRRLQACHAFSRREQVMRSPAVAIACRHLRNHDAELRPSGISRISAALHRPR
jgi:hypothetical protein